MSGTPNPFQRNIGGTQSPLLSQGNMGAGNRPRYGSPLHSNVLLNETESPSLSQQPFTPTTAPLFNNQVPSQFQSVTPTPVTIAPSTPMSQSNSVNNVAVATASQAKDINTASLCRLGQETVQEIISRTQEMFQTLKATMPPNGSIAGAAASVEKKVKVTDQLKTIQIFFKRLRLIYDKCDENYQGTEYTHIESLIPLKDDLDVKSDERKNTEAYRIACEENREIVELIMMRNRHLKEIVDYLRSTIWDINTMLAMRRP